MIIGGGPAGSTAANLLAHDGHDVLLLEKEVFPRFHIGESLLPIDLPIFQRLGVVLEYKDFIRKDGAEFIDERTGATATFVFREGLNGTPKTAYQVERSRFDHHLLKQAEARGAKVRHGVRVQAMAVEDGAVRVDTKEHGAFRARYMIDATGQDAFMARSKKTVQPLKGFGCVAVFRHFDGLAPGDLRGADRQRQHQDPDGSGRLDLDHPAGGAAPLRRGRQPARDHGAGGDAGQGDRRVADHPAPDRGRGRDRAAHHPQLQLPQPAAVRPALGLHRRRVLLSRSGLLVGRVAGDAGRRIGGREAVARPARRHRRRSRICWRRTRSGWRSATETFAAIVYRFYHAELVERLFFQETEGEPLRAGITSVLGADFFRDDNPFQQMLLNSLTSEAWPA